MTPALRILAISIGIALLASACRVSDEAIIERTAELAPEPGSAAVPDSNAGGAEDVSTDDGGSSAEDASRSQNESVAGGGAGSTVAPPNAPPADLPRALTPASADCEAPTASNAHALTTQGQAMFAAYVERDPAIASYSLALDVNPATGEIAGAMRAVLPVGGGIINFRVFAGMDAFDSGLQVSNVSVDGEASVAELDRALLTLIAPEGGGDTTTVELSFSYAIDLMAPTSIFGALDGESLQPDQVGLLGRTPAGMQLGHWFPVWLPDGTRTDPDPSGFGDIGAFPAANICATITAPAGYDVVTGGTTIETTDTSIVEAGTGLRDFSVIVRDDLALLTGSARGVEIRVWGPADNPAALDTVLGYTEDSIEVLSEAFGPYPWTEIDVISTPLGAGVGGMEWPGVIWIEQTMFGGGIAGMGELENLFGDQDISGLLGASGGAAITTALEWTVAHEVGHEWWHATVGNDSIASPAVDEPLAQFSACLVMERIHPNDWRDICDAQTIDQYAQARVFGMTDTAAEQPSDAFDSPIQYGAVVYGKAPGFYYAAGDLLGWDALTAALASFVAEHSFSLVSTDTLRTHLIEAAGDQGQVMGDLWDRWFREARGDQDIEPSDPLAGLGDLDLEGLDLDDLLGGTDLEDLLGDDFDLEGLDIEGLLDGNADIDQLLQDFIDATEGE